MTTLNQGLNTYRDLIRTAIATVEIGTGTTPDTIVDTTLESPLASKPAAMFSGAAGEFVARGRLGAAEGNGSYLTEVGLKTATTLTTRKTHAALLKTNLIEVEYEILVRLRNKT